METVVRGYEMYPLTPALSAREREKAKTLFVATGSLPSFERGRGPERLFLLITFSGHPRPFLSSQLLYSPRRNFCS